MCGIFGVITNNDNNVKDQIFDGLRRLEYRGYDSSGIATVSNNQINCVKSCLLYTSPSPRDVEESRMPSSA